MSEESTPFTQEKDQLEMMHALRRAIVFAIVQISIQPSCNPSTDQLTNVPFADVTFNSDGKVAEETISAWESPLMCKFSNFASHYPEND